MDTSLEEIKALDISRTIAVAMTPDELEASRKTVIEFCDKKISVLKREARELEENLRIAKKHGWRTVTLRGAIPRMKSRIKFYEKIRAASQAGYVIIPDFPVEAFAVRTTRAHPLGKGALHSYQVPDIQTESPAIGEGRYVNNVPAKRSFDMPDDKGKVVRHWTQDDFLDVEFPVAIAHPHILNATAAAMRLKIFDEIGLVSKNVKRDPIVVGVVKRREGYTWKQVNFFIAWWLNVENL